MTTYVLSGVAIYRNPSNDNVVGIEGSGIDLELVVPDTTTTMSYTLLPLQPGEDGREADIHVNDTNLRVAGQTITEADSPRAEILEVDWTQGTTPRTSIVMELHFDGVTVPGLGTVAADAYFVLSGSPLPSIASTADWSKLEASITSVGTPTGAFAPGAIIPLASLNGTMTQDDVILGTNGDDNFDGGAGNDHITGLAGNDFLKGGAGNDTLIGGSGSDILVGGGGNDRIITGDNTDTDGVQAGAGIDRVYLGAMKTGFAHLDHSDLTGRIVVNIDGDANSGLINKGTAGRTLLFDVATPMKSNSDLGGLSVAGTALNDIFKVKSGNGGWIQLRGGEGNDRFDITASSGVVRLDYSNATGGIAVNLANNRVVDDGFGDSDRITGTGRPTEIRSSMYNDKIIGSAGNDSFILMAGTDTLDGRDGEDRLRYDRAGVDGVDVDLIQGKATGIWRGLAFNHTIRNIEHVRGSHGDDDMAGANRGDILDGRRGADLIDGRGGNDHLLGGDGIDTLRGGNGNDTLDGGTGNDVLQGDAGADRLFGGAGLDTLNGGTGNDVLLGGRDADKLIGGGGTDTASYADSATGLRVDLSDAARNTGFAKGDTFVSIENLQGGRGNDNLTGDTGNNRLLGGAGNDRLDGGAGRDLLMGEDGNDRLIGGFGPDVLNGGDGDDILIGGGGRDTFVFTAGNDTITRFDDELLRLDDALWGGTTLTKAEILDFAAVVTGDTVFDFGGGNTLTIENYTDIAGLETLISVF